MQIDKLFYLALPLLFLIACNISINNSWRVPNSELDIYVYKQKPSALRDEVERQMTLRDKHLEKTNLKLARGMNAYSRINIYQTGANQYVLKDVFENYELDTQTKKLTRIGSPPDTTKATYIGTFDDNENGGWRYIPASERAEIPLTTPGNN